MALTKEQQSDLQMMKHPGRGSGWPYWPFLPVKKRGQTPSVSDKRAGVIVESGNGVVPTVYHVYIFGMKGVKLSEVPNTEYKSLEDLVADGWVVD